MFIFTVFRYLRYLAKREVYEQENGHTRYFPPFWSHPFYTNHDAFDRQTFGQYGRKHQPSKVLSNSDLPTNPLFMNTQRILDSTNTGLTNVGRTSLKLIVVLLLVTGVVFFITREEEIYYVNPPDLNIPLEFLTTRIHEAINTVENGYAKITESFSGSEHLMVHNHNSLLCPEKTSNLWEIASCLFLYGDVVIFNLLDAIPSYGRYISGAIDGVLQTVQDYIDVEEMINEVRIFVQKFVPLQDPSTENVVTSITSTNVTSSTDEPTKASFVFPPFPEHVVEVKTLCEHSCSQYAQNTTELLFYEIKPQGVTNSTPMTKRDYFFNVLNSDIIYICQHKEFSNFGGTWIIFDHTCLCSSDCQTSDYFGFTGCADMLSRLNVKCTSDNECNIPRICPFENRIIKIEINDQSDKLYDEMNEACLNVCSELAGFGSFATLVAIAATFTAIPTDVFGISNSPIGVELGALAPGISSILSISFIQTGVYSFYH